MAGISTETETGTGVKVVHAALFRMGTKSLAEAYRILGYRTYHGLFLDLHSNPWVDLELAAEATWPGVPGGPSPPREPFQRADWDRLWGSYDAVTDIAAAFTIELIKAYPEAKVVIVQRPFEPWWPSFRSEILDPVTVQPKAALSLFFCNILRTRAVHAMRKIHFGFFHAKSVAEIHANAKMAYDAHFEEIRRIVPPERLLEYKLGSGWDPLCEFLGVDVPQGVDFPHTNEKSMHQKELRARENTLYFQSIKVALPWVLGAGALVAAWLFYSGNSISLNTRTLFS